MLFRILYLNLLRLTQPLKSLACIPATHRLVGQLLVSLLVRNSQLVVWQIPNLLARIIITRNLLNRNVQFVGSQLATRRLTTRSSLARNLQLFDSHSINTLKSSRIRNKNELEKCQEALQFYSQLIYQSKICERFT